VTNEHVVVPKKIVGLVPKFFPESNIVVDPDVGPFEGEIELSTGPSNVKLAGTTDV